MDLTNIKKVEDLTLSNDVNRRLEHGWVLLSTYTNNYDPQTYPTANTLHYVLGLPDGVDYVDAPQNTHYTPLEEV